MTHQEQTAFPRVLEPFAPIVAKQEVIHVILIKIMVRIHDLKTDANADHGKSAKQDVRKEKNSGLLLEKLRVIPETIDVSFRHCIKVDEIIMPVESQIKDLLRQDKGTKQAEHKRVKVLVAGAGRDDTEKQNDGKYVEKYAHDAVVDMYR